MSKIVTYWMEPDESLIKKIDEIEGGWPAWANQLLSYHSVDSNKRDTLFACDRRLQDGQYAPSEWWSVCFTADKYYYNKISQSLKDTLKNQIISEIFTIIRKHL